MESSLPFCGGYDRSYSNGVSQRALNLNGLFMSCFQEAHLGTKSASLSRARLNELLSWP